MAERKAISKKLRFEVFKRDGFKCQYCGRQAPDVILEVDHIEPVSKGGKNNILNLITSCRDCNRGKGKRLLSDNAVVMKEREQLEEEHERMEQTKMIIEWKKELEKRIDVEVDAIADYIETVTKWGVSDYGKNKIRKLIKRYNFKSVYEATEISYDVYYRDYDSEYEWNKAFDKIGGICYNWERDGRNDEESD